MESQMKAIQTGGDSRADATAQIVGGGAAAESRYDPGCTICAPERIHHTPAYCLRHYREKFPPTDIYGNPIRPDTPREDIPGTEYHKGCCVCGTNIDTEGIFEPVWCGDCAKGGAGMTPATMAAMDAEIERQRVWVRRARGLEA